MYRGERGWGYAHLTSTYKRFNGPVSGRRDLTRRVEPDPVTMMRLVWHVAMGVSGNLKSRG